MAGTSRASRRSRADKNRRSDGKALELYVTEIGWTDSVMTEELQAAYLARAMFLFRRHAQCSQKVRPSARLPGVFPASDRFRLKRSAS